MVKLGKTIPAGDLFQLDDASSIPVWLQLKNRFIYLITSGFYLPGDQLPTVRGLAADEVGMALFVYKLDGRIVACSATARHMLRASESPQASLP